MRCNDVRNAEVRWTEGACAGGERGGDAGKFATGDDHDPMREEVEVGRNGNDVGGAAGGAADTDGGRALLNRQSACWTDAWEPDLDCVGTYDLCFACDEDEDDEWVASGGEAGGEGNCSELRRDAWEREGLSKRGSMWRTEWYVASCAVSGGGGTRKQGAPWAADGPARSTLAKGGESAFEQGPGSWGPWLRFELAGDTLADPRACAAPPGPPRTEYALALSLSQPAQISLSSRRLWWEIVALSVGNECSSARSMLAESAPTDSALRLR